MREHPLTLNFLYSSYSNKIANILPLHIQFIEFFSDGQLVAKDLFHGRRRGEKDLLCLQKETISAFELLPSTLIKKAFHPLSASILNWSQPAFQS